MFFFKNILLLTDSISLFVIVLFQFYVSSWFSLHRLYIPRNLSILFDYPDCWCLVVCNSPLWFISVISVVIAPLSFLILFESSLFLLFNLTKIWQFYLFKNKLLVLLFFSTVFSSFIFFSDVCYFLLIWSFVLLFLVPYDISLFSYISSEIWLFIVIYSSTYTAVAVCHQLWHVVFPFHFFHKMFWFPFHFFLIYWLFMNMVLNFYIFVNFPNFLLLLISRLLSLWS